MQIAAEFASAISALARDVAPIDRYTVSEWAERYRVVSAESGSPRPGRWSNDVVPYLAEIMDRCGFDDPCQSVTVIGSAQTGKSEIGLNVIGWSIVQDPCPALIVLPSIEEARKYAAVKFGAMVAATPELSARVARTSNTTEPGSTLFYRRYPGGFLIITTANSSKGLQMISARLRIYEEVTNYPHDVDGRGAPVDQAEARGKAWGLRSKSIFLSTPGIAGQCAITQRYDASDQRRWYCPCPRCSAYQVVRWDRLRWDYDDPATVRYECLHCGYWIPDAERASFVARGVWIPTYDGGDHDPPPPQVLQAAELDRWRDRGRGRRPPGYHIWQGFSPFTTWRATVEEYLSAQRRGPSAIKAFVQQTLGVAWEEATDAPDAQRLFDRRAKYSHGRAPRDVVFLIGATDVQGQRLEWAVWGYDRYLAPYLVDSGVIEGDATDDQTWAQHDALLVRRWPTDDGRLLAPLRWGVDSGYLASRVYSYVARHRSSGRVLALDGRPGWKHPPIGQPKAVRYTAGGARGTAIIHPVGTYDVKSEWYARVRRTIEARDVENLPRGAVRVPETTSLDYVRQLVSEHLVARKKRSGEVVYEWAKLPGMSNEALDLAVYCLAIALHETSSLTDAEWERLAVLGRSDDAGGAQSDVGGQQSSTRAAGGGTAMRGRSGPRRDDWLGVGGRWL